MLNQNEKINHDILDSPIQGDIQSPVYGNKRITNDSSVFYKGLFGMILCIVPAAIIGLVLIKISLEHAKLATKEYSENPSIYSLSSINMIKRGRTYAYIGLALFIVEIIVLVAYMSIN